MILGFEDSIHLSWNTSLKPTHGEFLILVPVNNVQSQEKVPL